MRDRAGQRAERERVQVMKKSCSTAIVIFADGGRDGGSGVVISPDGYIVTNVPAHAVYALTWFALAAMSGAAARQVLRTARITSRE